MYSLCSIYYYAIYSDEYVSNLAELLGLGQKTKNK